MSQIYWESQRGKLCRLHSLNTYFNCKKITDEEFHQYCKDYNQYIKEYYGETIVSQNYDIFPTYSLISYIIHKLDNKYCYFIPLNKLKDEKMSLENLIHKSTSFFVFNQNHVYLVKYHKNSWHKVDSLSGIVNVKLRQFNGRNMGFIIPRETSELEFDVDLFRTKIQKYLTDKNIKTTTNVKALINNNFKNYLLGDMEVWLSHLNQIYQIYQIQDNNKKTGLNEMLTFFYQNKLNEKYIHDTLPYVLKQLGFVVKPKKCPISDPKINKKTK